MSLLPTKSLSQISLHLEQYDNQTSLLHYGSRENVEQHYQKTKTQPALELQQQVINILSESGCDITELKSEAEKHNSIHVIFTFDKSISFVDQMSITTFMLEYSQNSLTNQFMNAILANDKAEMTKTINEIKHFIKHHE